MLVVHHLNNSRSQRILWLCEELGIDYEVVNHTRDSETLRAPPSLAEIHPLGKAPTVVHDGLVLIETDAIIEYVCHVCADGRLSRKPGDADYGPYLSWLAYSEGTLFPGLAVDLVYNLTGGGNETFKAFFDVEVEKNLAHLERALGGRASILEAGFSAADINLGWTLEFAECRGRLRGYKGLRSYLDGLRQRPAYARALQRGGVQDLSVFSAGVG